MKAMGIIMTALWALVAGLFIWRILIYQPKEGPGDPDIKSDTTKIKADNTTHIKTEKT